MMPNVTRGSQVAGLVNYLVGEGRANEHAEPHLVAGDAAMLAWHDDAELSEESGRAIARHLDRPRKAFGVDVNGGHVWHCSLSLSAEEGKLTDEQWQAVADDFVRGMGFDDQEGSRAPCRWVAVRHGVSKAGNDHVHIVVNLVREDGTKASTHRDFRRAQDVTRALEVKHGLRTLESVRAQRATRGYKPGEERRIHAQADAAARRKYEAAQQSKPTAEQVPWASVPIPEQNRLVGVESALLVPRAELARKVRACATASADEGEFVRRMRRAGVLVRPRFADGTTDVVTGYSVAQRPADGGRPIWYGGGHLGRDLTLPNLREGWPDTPEGASAAAAEWTAAKRQRPPVHVGREGEGVDPAVWDTFNAQLADIRTRLHLVPADDQAEWARIARETAGVFAAWSGAVEDQPGHLAAAADSLAVSAQTFGKSAPRPKTDGASIGGGALLVSALAHGGQGKLAEAVLLRQLVRVSQAVFDAASARGEAQRASAILTAERSHLREVSRTLPGVPVDVRARYGLAAPPAPPTGPTAEERAQQAADVRAQLTPEQRAVLESLEATRGAPVVSPVPPKITPEARPSTTTGASREVDRDTRRGR